MSNGATTSITNKRSSAGSSSNTAATTDAGKTPIDRFLTVSKSDPSSWMGNHLTASTGPGYGSSSYGASVTAMNNGSTAATQGSAHG